MERKNLTKHAYLAPRSNPTDVALEQALLVTTARLTMTVDETQNMNADPTADQPGGEMSFEY